MVADRSALPFSAWMAMTSASPAGSADTSGASPRAIRTASLTAGLARMRISVSTRRSGSATARPPGSRANSTPLVCTSTSAVARYTVGRDDEITMEKPTITRTVSKMATRRRQMPWTYRETRPSAPGAGAMTRCYRG